MFSDQDHIFMRAAMEEANKAGAAGEVPIGAVLVDSGGNIVARAGNATITTSDPTAHAEIAAIRDRCKQVGAQRIPDHDLYVTLEPCAMCTAAIAFARIRRLVFAAGDPKGGGVLHGGKFFEQPTCHHKIIVDHGLMTDEGGLILREFFAAKRYAMNRKTLITDLCCLASVAFHTKYILHGTPLVYVLPEEILQNIDSTIERIDLQKADFLSADQRSALVQLVKELDGFDLQDTTAAELLASAGWTNLVHHAQTCLTALGLPDEEEIFNIAEES